MRIYGRHKGGEKIVSAADNALHWVTPEQIRPSQFRGTIPVDVNLADQVILAGYDIDTTTAAAGERMIVRLYWEVVAPFEENKQVFVHLFDGEVQAQDDSAPECAVNPTSRWEPGQIIVDPHIVTIPAETPPGPLQLIVGMYDLLTRDRLVRVDGSGDSIYLSDIEIR
jgi:hypothetical protein